MLSWEPHSVRLTNAIRRTSPCVIPWLTLGGFTLLLAAAVPAPRPANQSDPVRVAIVSPPSRIYQAAAESLARALPKNRFQAQQFVLTANDQARANAVAEQIRAYNPDILATAGTAATNWTLEVVTDKPVVYFMVPNAPDAPFQQPPHSKRVCGVAADIDPAAQIQWIKRSHPECKHIAILHSANTDATSRTIERAARRDGLRVTRISARKDAFPTAIEQLERSRAQGVLMIPDAEVYNAATVKRLLVWGARQKRAVWAFSKNVVKAGAFAGLHANPDDVGAQAVSIIKSIADGREPQHVGMQHPTRIQHAINRHTGKMIGVPLKPTDLPNNVAIFGD